MKQIFLASAVCVLLIGCSKQSNISPEGTAAGSQSASSAAKDEKNQIDSAAKEAERQVSDSAKAQKDKIQSEAKEAKAEIDAQKAQAEAATSQAQKNLDEQSKKIHDAVGSAQQTITGQQRDEQQTLQKARDAAKQDRNVNVDLDNGTVVLRGTVNSQQEKDDVENHVKQATGDQNIKNDLKVNDNSNNSSSQSQPPSPQSNPQK